MKHVLFAVMFASLAAGASAQTDKQEVAALRGECSAKYSAKYMAKLDGKAKDSNEYQFVYSKGVYKGEQVAGKKLDCTEQQYAAYLNTVDPTRVMTAYPTAAGRPMVKPVETTK